MSPSSFCIMCISPPSPLKGIKQEDVVTALQFLGLIRYFKVRFIHSTAFHFSKFSVNSLSMNDSSSAFGLILQGQHIVNVTPKLIEQHQQGNHTGSPGHKNEDRPLHPPISLLDS